MEYVNVACAIDNGYLEHCGVMLQSLVANNKYLTFRIFILNDGLETDKQAILQTFLEKSGCQVVFVRIDRRMLTGVPLTQHISLAAYFRLLIPNLVNSEIQKILSLDSDIIIRHDISDLWNLNLDDYSLAAVENPCIDTSFRANLGVEKRGYFNSGVMLINVAYWREFQVTQKTLRFIQQSPEKIIYWDQDALNYILQGRWLRIESKWNAQHGIFESHSLEMLGLSREEYEEARTDPVVLHFSGPGICKPWHYDCSHPFKNEYYKYRVQTPWPQFRPTGQPARIYRVITATLGERCSLILRRLSKRIWQNINALVGS